MATQATFFDGETASSHPVMVDASYSALRVSGDSIKNVVWNYADLKAIEKAISGSELRLTSFQTPGARLIIPAGLVSAKICQLAPHLLGGFNLNRAVKTGGWVVASIAIVVGVMYALLTLAPNTIAGLMPNEWRDNLGRQTEKTVVGSHRVCKQAAGQRALLKLAGKVASGTNSPPDFSIRVYDMKLMNAFAVAGGRIVLTRGLIKAAQSPGEVAGVVAHELGHVDYRHPEAALVRILGLQLLISLATGGGDGETLGSLAGFATLLSYSRGAEREADGFAEKVLTTSKIDTVGLIDFFKRVKEMQDKLTKNEKVKTLFSMLSTHPGTDERIAKLKALPKGVAIEVLTPLEWKALKNICGETAEGQKTYYFK